VKKTLGKTSSGAEVSAGTGTGGGAGGGGGGGKEKSGVASAVKALEPRFDEQLCAFVFKVVHDPARGPLTFIRVYSGTLQAKQVLYNSTVGVRERVNQLLHVSADDLSTIDSLPAGNVGCLVGMKNTRTGDTLVVEKGPLHSYVLDGLVIPPPVFSLAIEPEKSSQQTELEQALAILQLEDPSLCVELDKESGHTMLKGIGELHLEIVCDKLKRQFNIEVMTGQAYVAYRETILLQDEEKIEHKQVYDRNIGTKRLFAGLTVQVSALKPDKPEARDMKGEEEEEGDLSSVVSSKTPVIKILDNPKQSLSADEIVALTEGLQSALQKGPKGFPVVGLLVEVTSVSRDQDTTSGSLRACASVLCNSVLQHSSRSLLEPIMALEVEAPRDFIGAVLSDLTQRRAQVKNVGGGEETKENTKKGSEGVQTILAHVPLATMLGYATSIRSMTQGQASFSLEYLKHLPVGYL
jgi:elongation factor G